MGEAEALHSAVRSIQPSHSLEIGLAYGISALAIFAAISANGSGHHYVIDPFQSDYANCGEAMITLAGLADRHTFLERFPEEAIPQLPGCNLPSSIRRTYSISLSWSFCSSIRGSTWAGSSRCMIYGCPLFRQW
jgi:Methyltransferase domain